MSRIKTIRWRQVLNSHVNFTSEFIVVLEDGSIGIGASPQGETVGIYEDKKKSINIDVLIQDLKSEGCFNQDLSLEEFDTHLAEKISMYGQNTTYGLSEAYFNAISLSTFEGDIFNKPESAFTPPYICFNILNGGQHAYTNPVLSDFPEYLLVSKSNDIKDSVCKHNEIQRAIKEKLLVNTKTVVAGNPVNSFETRDNRACIEFLLNTCESLGLSESFDLMIDASAGDLWIDSKYQFNVTDQSDRSSEEFVNYWLDLIHQYNIRFLEDPFHEKDYASWQALSANEQGCYIIGDNNYSSNASRIAEGAKKKFTHGVVIKPNQAGTITLVRKAISTAHQYGQITITSHRSISTESTFLSLLTCADNVRYIKIGPMITDYSSVIRLNEIIRLTEK